MVALFPACSVGSTDADRGLGGRNLPAQGRLVGKAGPRCAEGGIAAHGTRQ